MHHHHIALMKQGTFFVEPVGGTGWSKSVTSSQQMNYQHGQNKWNKAGENHQSSIPTMLTRKVRELSQILAPFPWAVLSLV